MRKLGVLFIWAWAVSAVAWGQGRTPLQWGAFRDSLQVGKAQTFQLRPFILPQSFTLWADGLPLDTTFYQLDGRYGRLSLRKDPQAGANAVWIATYRTLPFTLSPVYYRRKVPVVRPDSTWMKGLVIEENRGQGRATPFDGVSLQRNGSLTRGITVGNRRDLTVESGFRMQVSGELAKGVMVNASLTDENTPIQPEGNTQRLNEIDRILIELKTRFGGLNLGDFDFALDQNTFAKVNRKLQGVGLKLKWDEMPLPAWGETMVTLAGATSRGIYQSQTFAAQEGVQGPYRLQGKQGEQFIIVIAGSERVYLDGVLMTRGDSEDYVIDYASGEVMFTTKRLMTAAKRIVVEFEYTTNRFSRTLLGASAQTKLQVPKSARNLRLGASVLREADALSFGEELGLKDEELAVLKMAGDQTQAATISGAERVTYDPKAGFTHYVLRETTENGQKIQYFVPLQSLQETNEVYRVRFTRVPFGEGTYRRVGQDVNGIVYEWVGQNKGDYIPFRILPRPQLRSLATFNGQLQPFKGVQIEGEWAQSLNDQNRLSALDAEDDRGLGHQFGVQVLPQSLGNWKASGRFQRRFTDQNFAAFDRIRPVEFGRVWNLNQQNATGSSIQGADETTTEAQFRVEAAKQGFLQVEAGKIGYGTVFQGQRFSAETQIQADKGPQVQYSFAWIASQDATEAAKDPIEGRWLRQKAQLGYSSWQKIKPQFTFEQERRTQNRAGVLTKDSFAFTEWKPSLAWENERLAWGAELEWRDASQAAEGQLQAESRAWTARSTFNYRPSKAFSTEGDVGYRKKQFSAYFKTQQQAQDAASLVIRWNLRATPLKRMLDFSWNYEALTEKSPVLQEIYREVRLGEGEYQWIDSNKDGLRQVDEFFPAISRFDGNYVRLFVPSDALKPVVNVQARARLGWYPERYWANQQTVLAKVFRAIQTQTSLEILEKSEEKDLKTVYLLRTESLRNPDQTISGRLRFTQDLSLFRDQAAYGFNANYARIEGLNRLATGVETRDQTRFQLEARWMPHPKWGARFAFSREVNAQTSLKFASRTYNIQAHSLMPDLTWTPSAVFHLNTRLVWSKKEDRNPLTPKSAQVLRVPSQVRWSKAGKLQAILSLEYAHVGITGGTADGLSGFELTDGRGVGRSWLWNSTLNYVLSRWLRATLYYDGKAATDTPTLHTIRAQVNATF